MRKASECKNLVINVSGSIAHLFTKEKAGSNKLLLGIDGELLCLIFLLI